MWHFLSLELLKLLSMIVNENGLQISHEVKEGSIHWLAGRDFEQAEAKLTEALNQAEHINGEQVLMWAHTLTSSLQTLCLNLILDANASWGVVLNLWILILWTLSLRIFGKLKIVWIIAGFAFWVCGLIQFLWICGTLIDQEISIHGWASFLPAWLMFMHVEEVKALVISSLQRLVVQCQVPTWPLSTVACSHK